MDSSLWREAALSLQVQEEAQGAWEQQLTLLRVAGEPQFPLHLCVLGAGEVLYLHLQPGLAAVSVVLLIVLSLRVIFGCFWVILQGSMEVVAAFLHAAFTL